MGAVSVPTLAELRSAYSSYISLNNSGLTAIKEAGMPYYNEGQRFQIEYEDGIAYGTAFCGPAGSIGKGARDKLSLYQAGKGCWCRYGLDDTQEPTGFKWADAKKTSGDIDADCRVNCPSICANLVSTNASFREKFYGGTTCLVSEQACSKTETDYCNVTEDCEYVLKSEYSVGYTMESGDNYCVANPNEYIILLSLDGSDLYDEITAYYGLPISGLPIPTMDGYNFQGWFDDATGVEYANGDIYNLTDDAIFVAQWKVACKEEPGYTVTQNPTTDECEYALNIYTITLENGEKIFVDVESDIAPITPPAKAGYRFAGYYTGQNATGVMVYDEYGQFILSDADKINYLLKSQTLYADWQEDTCISKNGTIVSFNNEDSVAPISDLLAEGVVYKSDTGVANEYRIDLERFDIYMQDQRWTVSFDSYGYISGYAFCGPRGDSSRKPGTILDIISGTQGNTVLQSYSGCYCRYNDYEPNGKWVFAHLYDGYHTSSSDKWSKNTDACRQNCPAVCAELVATDATFRESVYGGKDCPVGTDTLPECNAGQYMNNGVCRPCPDSHKKSEPGAEDISQCYTDCTLDSANITAATEVIGNDYYGDGIDTCRATACDYGYNLSAGICKLETIEVPSGQYLPAGTMTPIQCPENNYCKGVKGVKFNSSEDQGITACPANTWSDIGADSAEDCRTIDANPEFTITTTKINAGDEFSFKISAAGHYRIDWGDGTIEYKYKENVSTETYSHIYNDTYDYVVIGMSGNATKYSENSNNTWKAVISFDSNTYVNKLGGNLGDIFVLNTIKHMFNKTFYQCTNLTEISDNLFAGISGGAESLFNSTFDGCSALAEIPSGLFKNISDSHKAMFRETFKDCSSLKRIPETLFSTITHGADTLFALTFQNCTGLGSDENITNPIPDSLFSGITTTDNATSMFDRTFQKCTSLSRLPNNLFRYITGVPADSMFASTFNGCTGLQGYISPYMFHGLTVDNVSALNNIFANTTLDTQCPAGTHQVITGFESAWSDHVACSLCPDGMESYIGANSVNQCFVPKKLHIGEDIIIKLSPVEPSFPRMVFDVSGVKYYGLLSDTEQNINSDTDQKLRMLNDDTLYWLHDYTVQ